MKKRKQKPQDLGIVPVITAFPLNTVRGKRSPEISEASTYSFPLSVITNLICHAEYGFFILAKSQSEFLSCY